MAQTETWDPKRYTPFEPGVRTERVLSTFPSIDTAVDNIKLSQGLERVAAIMDRGALIRTFQAADLGFILHSRHQYHWHTGYVPPQSLAMPHLGAVVAKTLGPRNPTVPAFVAIGQNLEIGAESAGAEVVPHGGLSRHGIRPVPDHRSAGCRLRRSSSGGARRCAFQESSTPLRRSARKEPVYRHAGDFQRRVADPLARCGRPSAHLALPPRRSTSRLNRRRASTLYNNGPLRAGLPAGPTSGGSGRALCGGHHRIHSLPLLGFP